MWKDNQAHGKGQYIHANGDKYVGEFLHDKFHGKGEYLYEDGS